MEGRDLECSTDLAQYNMHFMSGHFIFSMIILIFPAWKLKLPRATQLVMAGSRLKACPKLGVFPSPLTDQVGGGLLCKCCRTSPQSLWRCFSHCQTTWVWEAKEGKGGGGLPR